MRRWLIKRQADKKQEDLQVTHERFEDDVKHLNMPEAQVTISRER